MCQHWKQVFEKTKHRNLPYGISFSGGEATINKDFILFIEWLFDNYGHSIPKMGITTNGSASLSYYSKLFDKLTYISFSTHSEYMVPDEFLNKIKILNIYAKQNNKIAFVNVMQEYWATEQIKEVIDFCKNHDIPYAVSKIIYSLPGSRDWPIFKINKQTEGRQDLKITQDLLNYSNQEIDPLIEIDDKYYNIEITSDNNLPQLTFASKLNYLNLHQFEGWKCHAGLDRIFITPDSSVYSGECENEFMGKLDDNSFKLFDKPHTCKQKTCTNNPDDLQVIKYAV